MTDVEKLSEMLTMLDRQEEMIEILEEQQTEIDRMNIEIQELTEQRDELTRLNEDLLKRIGQFKAAQSKYEEQILKLKEQITELLNLEDQ